MDEDINKRIEAIRKEWILAVEEAGKYIAVRINNGIMPPPHTTSDSLKMGLAFAKEQILGAQLYLLYAEIHPGFFPEEMVAKWKSQREEARKEIEHYERGEFPSVMSD